MPQVVFDSLTPSPSCLRPAKRQDQAHPCTIQAKFHVRGSLKPKKTWVIFKRKGDHFILETQGYEWVSGLLKSLGVSIQDPQLQGSLYFSISLQKWFTYAYHHISRRDWPDKQNFLPLLGKIRDLLVTGAVFNTDALQRKFNSKLLRETLALSPKKKAILKDAISKLLFIDKSLTVAVMQPKLHWLADILRANESFDKLMERAFTVEAVRKFPEQSGLKFEIQGWFHDALIYLGTDTGNFDELKKRLDQLCRRIRKDPNASIFLEDIFKLFISKKFPSFFLLKKSNYFKNDPHGAGRLRRLWEYLEEAARTGRVELLGLKPPKSYRRSLEIQIGQAALTGRLKSLVLEEFNRSRMKDEFFQKKENLNEISEKILSAFNFRGVPGTNLTVQLNTYRLKADLEKLFSSHSIRRREFTIVALAVLRFLTQSPENHRQIKVWDGDKFVPASFVVTPEQQTDIQNIFSSLAFRISKSVARTERFLPWLEAGICVGGLGLTGAGIGLHHRGPLVGGSTVSGLGCGSLASHFIFRKNNHYIVDSIGGGAGAGIGFLLSWFLTRPRGGSPMNPPPPPPPPGSDYRFPTDEYGP